MSGESIRREAMRERRRTLSPLTISNSNFHPVFHDVVVHDESSTDIRFLRINDFKPQMPVHGQTVVIVFVAGEPDGAVFSFSAYIFQKIECLGCQMPASAILFYVEFAQK